MSIRFVWRLLAIVLAVSTASVPASAEGSGLTKASRVSFWGMGPVRIGMTVEQVRRATETPLTVMTVEEGCQDVWPSDRKDISFMAIDGIIRRIDILDTGILTISGVGVGDTEETVKRVYGSALSVEQHFYDPEGHYLIVVSPDSQSEILFETDGHKVTTYRTGRRQEVGYVEGCV